ncbi:MAG: hypothetical protein RDU25_02765 [Patescibacteria group bacterium]|nr:hypothetical protein [Patescibacteria group bacterium]
MPDIQEVFSRIQVKKKEKKKIKSSLRDAFSTSKPLQDLIDELRRLKDKKKGLENEIKAQFESEMAEMEKIESDVKSDSELLNDLALNSLIKGEPVEITDENDTKYEPILNVKFRKMG